MSASGKAMVVKTRWCKPLCRNPQIDIGTWEQQSTEQCGSWQPESAASTRDRRQTWLCQLTARSYFNWKLHLQNFWWLYKTFSRHLPSRFVNSLFADLLLISEVPLCLTNLVSVACRRFRLFLIRPKLMPHKLMLLTGKTWEFTCRFYNMKWKCALVLLTFHLAITTLRWHFLIRLGTGHTGYTMSSVKPGMKFPWLFSMINSQMKEENPEVPRLAIKSRVHYNVSL